jgi:predicted metalloendopeptidase
MKKNNQILLSWLVIAFGVTSQDKMYIAPENRIHIW